MCWFFKRDFQLEGEKKQMMLSNYFLEIPVKKPACNTGMHVHSTDSTMHAALNTMTIFDAFCPKIMILFV